MTKQSERIHQMIANQAEAANKSNPAISKDQYITRAYMDRFLARVFSDSEDLDWVLKGGSGIIARVPLGRRTTDVDLFTTGYKIEDAQERLIELAEIDLDDSFTFEFVKSVGTLDIEQQEAVELKRLIFRVLISGEERRILNVDLVVGPAPIGQVTTAFPKQQLEIPGFNSYPYRLYPLEHQIAEKVCATFSMYGGHASSREKDLVDLVVLATQSTLDGSILNEAINFEISRRELDPIEKFKTPDGWGPGYAKQASVTPACSNYLTIDKALILLEVFINPALSFGHSGTWDSTKLKWT